VSRPQLTLHKEDKEYSQYLFMEYHPSKKYIKASIKPKEILNNIPDNIVIPFFIEYASLHPYILYIFKRENDELCFIEYDELEFLFETCFHHPTSFLNHQSIFYEILNKTSNIPLDLSGTCYDDNTILWFATTHELYHTKNIFNIPFSSQVIHFFLDNPSLENLYWDNTLQPSPIIAYSQNDLRKTIFQSTFGTHFSKTPPHYTLHKNINNTLSPTVRFSLFPPFNLSNNNTLTFNQHIQHTPICYIKTFPSIYENDEDFE
jgi:hypothetical protein